MEEGLFKVKLSAVAITNLSEVSQGLKQFSSTIVQSLSPRGLCECVYVCASILKY